MGITGQKKNMSKSTGHAEECCVHVVAMARTSNDRDGDWPITRKSGRGQVKEKFMSYGRSFMLLALRSH